MLYTDFLKSTVLLAAAEGTALAAVAIAVAASQDDTTTIVFAVSWWVVAAAVGAWLGRRDETTRAIGRLLAAARTSNTLPEIRPGAVLLNRLWLLAVSAVVAAGLSWLFPQFAAVVAGGAFLVALAWRKQEAAVTAIEERDGVRYYVIPSSPFGAIELMRTPGLRRVPSVNGAGS
ncbi:MAG TPA: hypothetical protein VFB51_13045 [Solirubrobacterales bacterium]|nr:hypothetical protein [Solirubrobacterales bacterium]